VAQRGTWVWSRPDPAELLSWTRQHHIGELFLAVRADVADTDDLAWVRTLVQQARAEGVRVSALGGDPLWIDKPAAALEWARAAVGTGLFDGVHLDLEVWAHDDWGTRRDELVTGYLDLLRRLAAACPLPMEAGLAHWLHQVATASGATLDAAVMRIVDAVTVLSFRNTATGPDSITEVGAAGLAAARRVGIPCRLAVETNDLGLDPEQRKQTFHGKGITMLAKALATVDAMEASVTSYAGIAIQDYDGWRAL
jgi:hypothetical protein